MEKADGRISAKGEKVEQNRSCSPKQTPSIGHASPTKLVDMSKSLKLPLDIIKVVASLLRINHQYATLKNLGDTSRLIRDEIAPELFHTMVWKMREKGSKGKWKKFGKTKRAAHVKCIIVDDDNLAAGMFRELLSSTRGGVISSIALGPAGPVLRINIIESSPYNFQDFAYQLVLLRNTRSRRRSEGVTLDIFTHHMSSPHPSPTQHSTSTSVISPIGGTLPDGISLPGITNINVRPIVKGGSVPHRLVGVCASSLGKLWRDYEEKSEDGSVTSQEEELDEERRRAGCDAWLTLKDFQEWGTAEWITEMMRYLSLDFNSCKSNIRIEIDAKKLSKQDFPTRSDVADLLERFKLPYLRALREIQQSSDYGADCVKLPNFELNVNGRGNLGIQVAVEHDRDEDIMLLRWWDFKDDDLFLTPDLWRLPED